MKLWLSPRSDIRKHMIPGILVSAIDLRVSISSVLEDLQKAFLLKKIVTTIAIEPERSLGKFLLSISGFLPGNLSGGIKKRTLPGFLKGTVDTFYSRELIRLLVSRLGNEVLSQRVWLWAELGFDRRVADEYAGKYACIYGMEHSSCLTFERQKDKRGFCILRQVIAHGRYVAENIKKETEKFPEYTDSFMRLFLSDMARSIARKEQEYRLADLIIVNSNFVKKTFISRGISPEKIAVVPTGCPSIANRPANPGKNHKPLIFLFVGRISLRKGLQYLIKAWNSLKVADKAELWLVGANEMPGLILSGSGIRHLGFLSQQALAKVYAQADVFVLPTLLEGLAYVLLEALSYGLPIITTEESGCANLVENGGNGFIVKAGDSEELASSMNWCLEHSGELKKMGEVSLEKARSWTILDSNLAHLKAISEFLKDKGVAW